MNMKLFQKLLKLSIILLVLISCTEKTTDENLIEEPKKNIDFLPSLNVTQPKEDSYIVVLLGYGYNDGFIKTSLLKDLETMYGFAQNNGIIIPFVYPDDFLSYGYERISLLPNNILDELQKINKEADFSNIAGIITLGAPENTHYALASLQDSDYVNPVFSVFPQDNILGIEAGSTLVIDYMPIEETDNVGHTGLEEINSTYPDNIFPVIAPLINVSLEWKEIKEGDLFIPALRKQYNTSTKCNFSVYLDPQTKIRAKNHYVLVQK